MATTTDYPRYYGNGTGRDSYIHSNNGGLRNMNRSRDFRVHLRGGPALLSDGSQLGGGIPLPAGIAGGARPIRLPTLDGRKKQTAARQRAVSDWLATSRSPRGSGLQVTDHFAALDIDMQYEVNSARRAPLPIAPHHGGSVRAPGLYHYNRSSKRISSDSVPLTQPFSVQQTTQPFSVPLPPSSRPQMTRSAPLALSRPVVPPPVVEDTTQPVELTPADEDNTISRNVAATDNTVSGTNSHESGTGATATFDPFARGFDIVRSTLTEQQLNSLTQTGKLQPHPPSSLSGSLTHRPRRRGPNGSEASATGGAVVGEHMVRENDGSLSARSYYHTNWLRKDAF